MENGRVALVSGVNSGTGHEFVRQLAERGIATILGSRDEEKGRAAAEGIDGDVYVRRLDATDEKGIRYLPRPKRRSDCSTSWSTTPGSP